MGLQVEPPQPDSVLPDRPRTFHDDDFVLPAHKIYSTMRKNAHPRDANIRFYEKEHIYVDVETGTPFPESVTGVVHKYENEFNADVCIHAMKKSLKQRWPRLEYVWNATAIPPDAAALDDVDKGYLLVRDGATVSVVQPHSFQKNAESIDILSCLKHIALCDCEDGNFEIYEFEREMTGEEIKNKWSLNGMLARNIGTWNHLQMQLYTEGEAHHDEPEVLVGKAFFSQVPDHYHIFATELEIWSRRIRLAGSVDCIIRNDKTGALTIIDYKVSDKLCDSMHGFKKMKAPMNHMDDCKGAGYALQLSMYQWILEEEYGYKVEDRILMSISAKQPFWTSVPYLRPEIDFIVQERLDTFQAYATCPYRCSISQDALYDGVVVCVDDAETTVNRKVAQLQGLDILRDNHDLTDSVMLHVCECLHRTPRQGVTPANNWKKQMPKTGIQPTFA